MNNPCKDLSYRAKLKLSLMIDDILFSSEVFHEFEVGSFPKLNQEELEEAAIESFSLEHNNLFIDTDIEISVLSIKKF